MCDLFILDALTLKPFTLRYSKLVQINVLKLTLSIHAICKLSFISIVRKLLQKGYKVCIHFSRYKARIIHSRVLKIGSHVVKLTLNTQTICKLRTYFNPPQIVPERKVIHILISVALTLKPFTLGYSKLAQT